LGPQNISLVTCGSARVLGGFKKFSGFKKLMMLYHLKLGVDTSVGEEMLLGVGVGVE